MSAVLHIELVEQTADALQLRFWRDNPNALQTRTLGLPEIADLVGKAETDYYSPLPAKLQEIGQRLFRWLDGGERWITTEIAAAANQAPVLVLAIAMPHRLAHLPWEVLHDGTAFLVHALNPPVLPVRWRNGAGSHPFPPQNRPLQALFMAASPADVQPVLDYEHEEAVILEATEHRQLDLTVEESGCLEELGELMQDYGAGHFDVLHLTGHADHAEDGRPVFLLEDSEGQRAEATALDIAKELPRPRPPLVFLSGCRTGQLLGSVSGALGLRKFLEENGHELVVTSDKDGPDSVLERELPDADIVISQPFWPAYMTAARIVKSPRLKLIVTAGIGSDHTDLQAAIERGITVAEVTYCNSISVAEHVVMMILSLVRNYIPSYQWVIDKGWNIADCVARSYDLEGMAVGTVAAGRIGLAVLRRLKPFDVKLHYTDRHRLSPDLERDLGLTFHANVESLVRVCDVVTINCPLHPETEHLFNEVLLGKMKRGAYIVNTARGKICEREAIARARWRAAGSPDTPETCGFRSRLPRTTRGAPCPTTA